MDVLLCVGKGKTACEPVIDYCQHRFGNDLTLYSPCRNDTVPDELLLWEGELLVSYLCPVILPVGLLQRAELAINFHPGPPEYPGSGCVNWALYDGTPTYGVTVHTMGKQVDAGPILAVKRFRIDPGETVSSLTTKCHAHLLSMFYDVTSNVLDWTPVECVWGGGGKRRTRADLDALCRIGPDMDKEEVARRVRATTYPGAPGPYIEVHGYKFTHTPELVTNSPPDGT